MRTNLAVFGIAAFVSFQLQAGAQGLEFEPNLGQSAPSVRYLGRSQHGLVFLTDTEIRYQGAGGSLGLEFEGAKRNPTWIGLEKSAGSTSYLVGNDPGKWVRDVPHFSRMAYDAIYPGIDLILYQAGKGIEYDFVLRPHASA